MKRILVIMLTLSLVMGAAAVVPFGATAADGKYYLAADITITATVYVVIALAVSAVSLAAVVVLKKKEN